MKAPWPASETTRVRRAPRRLTNRGVSAPAITDMTPWKPKTRPVSQADRSRISCRYRVSTKITVDIIEKVTRPPRLPHATVRRRSIGRETRGASVRDSTTTKAVRSAMPAIRVAMTSARPKPWSAAVVRA
jgi:hypothetical protein